LTSANGSSYNWDLNGNGANTGDVVGGNNQLSKDGVWTYSYDPVGDLVEKDGVAGGPNAGVRWVYGYDNVNHLVSATQYLNGVLQLQEINIYDVYGNRVEQDVTQGSTTVTKFAYNQVSGDGNIWVDLSGSGAVQARREYLDGLDAVFARVSSTGGEDWYLTYHLGSVRGLENDGGTLDDSVTYNPWGAVTSESNPTNGDREKDAGYQYDAATGMYYVGWRWYDPGAVRWVSPDPLGLGPDSNPYRYAGDSPTDATDPSGLHIAPARARLQQQLRAQLDLVLKMKIQSEKDFTNYVKAYTKVNDLMGVYSNQFGPLPDELFRDVEKALAVMVVWVQRQNALTRGSVSSSGGMSIGGLSPAEVRRQEAMHRYLQTEWERKNGGLIAGGPVGFTTVDPWGHTHVCGMSWVILAAGWRPATVRAVPTAAARPRGKPPQWGRNTIERQIEKLKEMEARPVDPDAAAKELGFRPTNYRSHGQPVYYHPKTKMYISPDVDSHSGGVWKMADSVEHLGSKNTRMGTYDADLNRVGD
jgi:RHS repeat-associated protein